jgi:hypothetical protein
VGFNRRPLGVQDAVDASVTQCADSLGVLIDLMITQDAIQLGAQALDGAAALLVEEMSSKFHGIAVKLFKGMGQKHSFAFGVNE